MALRQNDNDDDKGGVSVEINTPSEEELKETKHNSSTTTASNDDRQEPPLFSFMTGIRKDLANRLPLYIDDWKVKNVFTVINATVYAFVIQLIPALIFAELLDRETRGNLAVSETLLSSAIMGIIYALFAGQPLVIMGITGPVAILLGTSYTLTEKFEADYFSFFFWTCIWAGLFHVLSAMVGLVQLVWKVTPFTCQIFELFIAVTFIYSSIRDLVSPIDLATDTDASDRGASYGTLFVGLITFYIAWTLHFAETWIYFNRTTRVVLTSYNTLLAVVVGTAFSFLPGVDQNDTLERVAIREYPWDWQPTADRPWIANPVSGIDARGIFAAMIPGFMFFLLFIIDHNVSSILTQSPEYKLKKPSAYHWDFFVVGLTFLPCAFLGLPPGNGLIPQAPLHCRALCTRKYIIDHETGLKKEVVEHCEEQRYSGLGQSLLMLVALASFRVVSWIPRGSLFGLFLYLGMGALHGNEIYERFVLSFMREKHRPDIAVVKEVNWTTVQIWTLVQAGCAFAIFGVAQFASVGYIYPALLALLVPFRSYILERCFSADDLVHLDPVDQSFVEFEKEHHAIDLAMREASFSENDHHMISRSEFRVSDQFEHPSKRSSSKTNGSSEKV